MNQKNILLVLWIIFGFVFITAIDSILYFILHLIYFGLAELGVSYKIMTVMIPITTLLLYILTTFILLVKIKTKSKTSGIYLIEFPKKLMIIMGVIAFSFGPITNKLSGIYAEYIYEGTQIEVKDHLSFYGWFHFSFGAAQLLVLVILVGAALFKLKKLNNTR